MRLRWAPQLDRLPPTPPARGPFVRLRVRASAPSRRSAKAVCLSDSVLGAQRGKATSESQPPDCFPFPPSLPSHIAIHPSPAFARAAMAEPSAATQSPSVSSSSSVAESSAPGGGGGSPGACPALGAKSCGSSCAGEARRGTPTSGGGGPSGSGTANHPRVLEASAPGKERLEKGVRGRGASGLAGGEEITGCEENRLGEGRYSREWALTPRLGRWGKTRVRGEPSSEPG